MSAERPDLQLSWAFLEHSDLVASAAQVEAAIAKMAVEIQKHFKDKYPLVLVVMGGAVVFAGQLLPRLRLPLDLDYIHASRYGAATVGGGIDWRVEPPRGVRGRAVLVLDDILDGGHTMCAIRERVLELGAESFSCAVLVEKILPVEKPLTADFIGLRIPDRFVFGCGMDAKGYWRNLPEIRAMRGS
ncbi:MAG: hypoxanthine-guanine phosphoribosyltransferase [Betaproteobacteria bacterium]|nr:hypoxanthine-guanine phosphoribosyltransferase [Betaproteobacteria bacterium]MSQ87947.1 hypoxanthine-guanine phosphoribosyltransferase [Betaproteobacteria bacterium]